VARQENFRALEDCGVLCRFSRGMVAEHPDRVEALFEADLEDLLAVGARVVELERHFNNQRGFDREDDTVPYVDQLEGFEAALEEYYEVRGWTTDGTVPDEQIESGRLVG
jgi:aldehyde:ferredoxin oxidoreductase